MMRATLVLLTLVASSRAVDAQDRCTAIVVGAKASTNGAPMTTHTNDCSNCDFRIAKVPAQTHEDGAVHGVILFNSDYPRYVGTARGDVYLPENLDKRLYNWTDTPVIGTIPEAAETYAYIDGTYGIINEHQVAIGESTCGARFYSKPVTKGGDALFDVSELSRIALQRTKTAREAIQVMGDLAVKYGYYGAEWEGEAVYSEAGEALTVTDTAEAWMFHILPDDTGKSAIWAAQRVPDDHISVVANQFVIHEIELNQTDYFMASENIYDVAIRNNLWTPDQGVPFDFTKVYSMPREEGHQYYSTRRVWRLFTLADPELDLSSETDVYSSDYPFSIKPAQKLSPHDIMRFQRDHYEGTPFDMTKGPSGGPYGDPDRYDEGLQGNNITAKDLSAGHFERAISIFRASYSFVSILDPKNADNAYVWFGQYAPHATTYGPVYTKVNAVPVHYSTGSLFAFGWDSSFWIHALVGNWAARFYKFAHPFVAKTQLANEAQLESVQADVLAKASELKNASGEDAMIEFLTNQSALFAAKNHEAATTLFETLVTTFHDGYQMSNFNTRYLTATPLFYPKWWLQLVGFFSKGQEQADTTATTSSISSSSKAEESVPGLVVTPTGDSQPASSTGGVSHITTILVAIISCAIGVLIGRRFHGPLGKKSGYRPLH